MTHLDAILERALSGAVLSAEELEFLLALDDPGACGELYRAAYELKLREVGKGVYLRGLIETSNLCTRDCAYCGIRRSNTAVRRYELALDEIVAGAKLAASFGYGAAVLQGGERSDRRFVDFVTEAVRRIRALPAPPALTLSFGEQTFETYRMWCDAGAERYLLRIETSDPGLYAALHPDSALPARRAALIRLREAGFQVGTGVMIGLPGQSAAMLASMGFPGAGVAADTAILMREGRAPARPVAQERNPPVLGLCISTQRQVVDLDGVRRLIAAVRAAGARVLGIPMNIKTDRALLEKLGVECIPGTTPEAVVEAAAGCDVVLSSRLHLLILAANAGTPGLGIARGSKLANWLSNFGQTVVGSVYDCDWDKVTELVLAAFKGWGEPSRRAADGWGEPSRRAADDWPSIRAAAYERLTNRLEKARTELIARLTS